MSIKKLFEALFRIIGDSDDYFITGSLTFLPLVPPYREPAHDIDVSVSRELFQTRRNRIAEEGKVKVLRLPEVAVAMDSSITRILVPRTSFIHVDTGEGLLDLSYYQTCEGFLNFKLGAGLTFVVPDSVLDRTKILSWEGFDYRAGPPEFAFLPKAVLYPRLKRSTETLDKEGAKHLEDLKRLARIIDWEYSADLLDQLQVHWFGRPIPRVFDRRFNPFREVDLNRLRDDLL